MRSSAAVAARTTLVLFHVVLLFQRLADGSILHPAVAEKWLLSALLAAGVMLFQHRAPAQSRGARALMVFWLLVLVLHVAVPLDGTVARYELAATVPLVSLLPAAAVAILLLIATLTISIESERHRLEPITTFHSAHRPILTSPRAPPRH